MPGPPSPLTAPTLLAVGRLRRQKGFDTLIRSFARIARDCPDWTLRICGGGPWRSKLEQLVVEQGLEGRVVLAGRNTRIAEEMEKASIYVLSSRFEGFPMVMIEAMSKGLPVVSFDCPTGPREIVHDGVTGLLVPDQDEGALAVAMLDLIRSESRRRELGTAGVEEARRYSLSAIGPRWDELFADLAETAPGPLSPEGPPGTLRPARREG
jgi:glycosyltransferase involved in cell wall biosynthesis